MLSNKDVFAQKSTVAIQRSLLSHASSIKATSLPLRCHLTDGSVQYQLLNRVMGRGKRLFSYFSPSRAAFSRLTSAKNVVVVNRAKTQNSTWTWFVWLNRLAKSHDYQVLRLPHVDALLELLLRPSS